MILLTLFVMRLFVNVSVAVSIPNVVSAAEAEASSIKVFANSEKPRVVKASEAEASSIKVFANAENPRVVKAAEAEASSSRVRINAEYKGVPLVLP